MTKREKRGEKGTVLFSNGRNICRGGFKTLPCREEKVVGKV